MGSSLRDMFEEVADVFVSCCCTRQSNICVAKRKYKFATVLREENEFNSTKFFTFGKCNSSKFIKFYY